jgi:hypothetical protein
VGARDGIYIWEFNGDTETSYHPEATNESTQYIHDKALLHQPTMLERMRDSVKDRMKPKLAKDSFIVPPFVDVRSSSDGVYRLG